MSLDRLLFEVTMHYRSRGFPDSALSRLRWILSSNVNLDTGRFWLKTAYPTCDKSIGELLGLFQPVKDDAPAEGDLTPTVVFGFAFGYQMAEWLDGTRPMDELEARLRRRPGKNNTALAKIAEAIYVSRRLPLYLQFEIADAVTPGRVAFSSSRKDQNTIAVATEFIEHAKKEKVSINSVLLLAHRHHYERCRIVLNRMGVQSVPIPNPYEGYDENEAQPRVMSAEENIINDFASMAGMLAHR